jgi:hypothetical protein
MKCPRGVDTITATPGVFSEREDTMPKKSPRHSRRRKQTPSSFDDDRKRALDEAIVRHYARQQEGLPPPAPSTIYLWGPHRRWLAEQYPRPKVGEPSSLWITNPAAHHPEPFDSWLREHYPAVAERLERDREEHAREMKEWKEKNTGTA